MKVPKKIIKKDKELEYLGKCGRLYIYQDKFGIRETFTAFDLGGIDNTEIDKIAIQPKSRMPSKCPNRDYKIAVTDLVTGIKVEYDGSYDVANAYNMSQSQINDYIQNKKAYKRRYKFERVYREWKFV